MVAHWLYTLPSWPFAYSYLAHLVCVADLPRLRGVAPSEANPPPRQGGGEGGGGTREERGKRREEEELGVGGMTGGGRQVGGREKARENEI